MKLTELAPVTAKDILKMFYGMPTKGQLMKLCERGIIKPYREAQGTGSNRLFDWYNLLEIGIWRELHLLRCDSTFVGYLLENLREDRTARAIEGGMPEELAKELGLRKAELRRPPEFLILSTAHSGPPTTIKPSRSSHRRGQGRTFEFIIQKNRKGLQDMFREGLLFGHYGDNIRAGKPFGLIPNSAIIINLNGIREIILTWFEDGGKSITKATEVKLSEFLVAAQDTFK